MTNDFKKKMTISTYGGLKNYFSQNGGNLRLVRTLNNRYNRAILIKETAKETARKETA